MNREKLEKLVLTAMFCAIVVAMTFIPFVGYITYGLLSITTLHVVVILGAVTLGPARGAVIGLIWGITCLIYAAMNGTADAVIFLNPLISVLPRFLVGWLSGLYFRWFSTLFGRRRSGDKIGAPQKREEKSGNPFIRWMRSFRGKGPEALAAMVTGALGTLTNTVLVLTAVHLLGGGGIAKMGALLQTLISTALSLNMAVELPLAAVVVPAVAVPLLSLMRRHGRAQA